MPDPHPSSLYAILQRFAARQPREEVARQYAISSGMELDRRVLSFVAFLTSAVFLPLWLCALLSVLEMAAELAGFWLMRSLDPARQPLRYFGMLASYMVSQAAYCLVPVLCWQLDDPMAKSYAVGAMMVSLIHVATVRTVHLPLAMAGGGVIEIGRAHV